jgi:hypothetical protein
MLKIDAILIYSLDKNGPMKLVFCTVLWLFCIIGLQLLIQEVWRPMVGIFLQIGNGKCYIILSVPNQELKSRKFWKEKDVRFKCFRLLQNRLKSKLTQNPTTRYGRSSNRSGFRGFPGGRIDYTGYFTT